MVVAACLGVHLWLHRIELFVVPARWREAVNLHSRAEVRAGNEELRKELRRKLEEIVRLQSPAFDGSPPFDVELGVKTEEGREAHLLISSGAGPRPRGDYLQLGHRFQLLDARGRLIGESFQVPPDVNGKCFIQGWWRVEGREDGCTILRMDGFVHYEVSFDASGIVPRGAVLLNGAHAQTTSSTVPISFALSHHLKPWLDDEQSSPLEPDAIASLVRSPRENDVYRGLYSIERLGARASELARPLLSHPDADLRARGAGVIGNDGGLAREILPLLDDPSPRVRTAARFALLAARDSGLARNAWVDLLRENHWGLEHVDFDRSFLASTAVADAILERIEMDDVFIHDLSFDAIRPEHLRPLAGRIEALWRLPERPDRSSISFGDREGLGDVRGVLVPWVASAGDPRLDGLLLEVLTSDRNEPIAVLGALLERKEPLQAEGAIAAVARIARQEGAPEANRLAAYFLLLRWGVSGAREELVRLLGQDRGAWLETDVTNLWSYAPASFVPDFMDVFLDTGVEDLDGHGLATAIGVLEMQPREVIAPLRDRLFLLEKRMAPGSMGSSWVKELLGKIGDR